MLEMSCTNYEVTRLTVFKEIQDFKISSGIGNNQNWYSRFGRNKKQLECLKIKSTITKIKNSVDGFSSKHSWRDNELESGKEKVTQNAAQRDNT